MPRQTAFVEGDPSGRAAPRREALGKPPSVPELHPGAIVGGYRLVRRVGSGTTAVVFEAVHVKSGNRVALKCLRPHLATKPRAVKRFLGDAVAATSIEHSGIAKIFDYAGGLDGVAYVAMEYLEGETLAQRLDRCGRLRTREALSIARQLTEILSAVHAAGIVHRDLKPGNIYLLGEPGSPGSVQVKLIDFGVAKFSRSRVKMSMQTRIGQIVGTPRYMSPEQGRGDRQIDARSDIYSLGCILYHALCGAPPFRGTLGDVLLSHQFETPRPMRSIDDRLPRALEELVAALMAKDPEHRPATMSRVCDAIETVYRDPHAPALPGLAPRPRRRGRLVRAIRTTILCVFVVTASAAATHVAASMGIL